MSHPLDVKIKEFNSGRSKEQWTELVGLTLNTYEEVQILMDKADKEGRDPCAAMVALPSLFVLDALFMLVAYAYQNKLANEKPSSLQPPSPN